jgi:rhodanese-related sulfurtransferase
VSYQDIHVSEVDELLKTPGLTVLDMRDEAARSQGQLPSALPHSDDVIGGLMRRRRSNPPVLVYCYHGNTSRDLCSFLGQMGLERVYNLEGGWQAWETWQQSMKS